LVNCARFTASLAQGPGLEITDLPPNFRQTRPPTTQKTPRTPQTGPPIPEILYDLPYREAKQRWVEHFDNAYLYRVLDKNDGNISAAARVAGIHRKSIQRFLNRQTDQNLDPEGSD
jgi:DNA-binding NtrC family response regulator